MSHDLNGHHALICGASRGIGQATAKRLAACGARTTLLARSEAPLRALADALNDEGGDAQILVADLEDPSLASTLETFLNTHGGVDIVVHNTGGPPADLLVEAPNEALEVAFRRHVQSAQTLMKATLPHMKETGYGRFIQVLSTSVREPIPNLGVSNIIRAAMASWAKSLSRELPPGITINNILPGFTDTDRLTSLKESVAGRTGQTVDQVLEGWLAQVPEGRLASPEETASAIAFLASPDAGYIRGVSLAVDGGRTRSI